MTLEPSIAAVTNRGFAQLATAARATPRSS